MSSENRVVYQPYKTGAKEWQVDPDSVRMVGEKTVHTVLIGTRIKKDQENNIVKQDQVAEEIYFNVLQGIFTQSEYKVKVRLGREPSLIVTYNGELVPHNDKVDGYVKQLCEVFKQMDKEDTVKMLVNGILNENIQERFASESQQFVKKTNDMCGTDFSPEFITEALKRYFCEDIRHFDLPGARDLHFAAYTELVNVAGEVLLGRLRGIFDENQETVLLDELLYRLLCGSLVEKG